MRGLQFDLLRFCSPRTPNLACANSELVQDLAAEKGAGPDFVSSALSAISDRLHVRVNSNFSLGMLLAILDVQTKMYEKSHVIV